MNLVDTSEPNFWTNVYKVCFKSIQDNKFIWFQYRIINNIFDTNNYLNKVKIQDYNTCHLCSYSPETVNHLFAECDKALELWVNVKQWVTNRTSIYLELNDTTKILGYITYDEKFWAANFILMVTRFYIYWCSKKKLDLNIFYLQRKTRGMLLLTKAKRPLKFKMLCGSNKHAVKLRMHKAAPYAFPIPLNTF